MGSDHGFGPIEKFLCFNVWLIDEGLLVLKRDAMTLFKRALFKLGLTPDLAYRSAMKMGLAHLRLSVGVTNRSKLMKLANVLMLSLEDVDWSRTVAFSKGNYGQIFINLRGRESTASSSPEPSMNERCARSPTSCAPSSIPDAPTVDRADLAP